MDALPDHIADLIRRGRKIEAVALIREETGVGLKEAQEAVDALSQGDDPLDPETVGPGHIPEDVQALARNGRKIEAIKLLRERTGLGLKEAKDVVEAISSVPAAASRRVVIIAMAIVLFLVGLGMFFAIALSGCTVSPASAGPVFAAPMPAPPDGLTGGYVRVHTTYVLEDEWTPVEVRDTLVLRQDGDRLDVYFWLTASNWHSCRMEGTAHREGDAFVLRDTLDLVNGPRVCTLRLTVEADSITLHDDEDVCRRYYCGARAHIDGIRFPR